MTDTKRLLNISSFLATCRQESANQSKASAWFLAIFSAAQEGQDKQIVDDISTSNRAQLLQLITGVVVTVSGFYQQERPTRIYKVLNLMSDLLELWQNCRQFGYICAKVSYLNALALFHLRFKNYSYAIEAFSIIYDIFSSKPVDCINQVFLSSISNYISLLNRVGKRALSKKIEVQEIFSDLFFKFMDRMTQKERQLTPEDTSALTLLSGILNQHYEILKRFEKQLNMMVSSLYQMSLKSKKNLPQNMIGILIKERVRKSIYFKINFNYDELLFYSSNKFKIQRGQSQKQQRNSEELMKMQNMIKQNNQVLQELKLAQNRMAFQYQQQQQRQEQLQQSQQLPSITSRKRTLQKHSTIVSNVPSIDLSKQSIDLSRQTIQVDKSRTKVQLPRTFTKRKQVIKQATVRKQKWGIMPKALKFKIHSIFIDIFEDGILFSDYTNQNKRYVEWNTISLIIQRLQSPFVFEEYIKSGIDSYFDFTRILHPYLTKNDRRQICLLSRPIPLLVINFRIRMYQQEGRYLKLSLMNQYDPQKYEGIVDLFLGHYNQFFKQLSQNQYLLYMNDRISKGGAKEPLDANTVFRLEFIKPKRDSTATELGNLLSVQVVEAIMREKVTGYKCIFLLRNKIQLLVKLIDKIGNQKSGEGFIGVQIEGLDSLFSQDVLNTVGDIHSSRRSRTFQIPMTSLTQYFPIFNYSSKEYLQLYSRMIVDCLYNQSGYQDDPDYGGLFFSFRIFCSRTEMIEYGKYFSVVSAQLVGSSSRVWALVIRFYDLAYLRYSTCVLMNPYQGFLQHVLEAEEEQRMKILKNLLIRESVKTTFLWLKERQKMNSRFNMYQYLIEAQLI